MCFINEWMFFKEYLVQNKAFRSTVSVFGLNYMQTANSVKKNMESSLTRVTKIVVMFLKVTLDASAAVLDVSLREEVTFTFEMLTHP